MSEAKTKKVTAYTVPQDKTISLEISGHFYKRLTGAYFNYLAKFPTEKTEEYFKAIAQKKIEELQGQDQVDAFSIETLLIFMADIELQFKNAGFIEAQEVEIPTED